MKNENKITSLAPSRSTNKPIIGAEVAAVMLTNITAEKASLCDQPRSNRMGPKKTLKVAANKVAMQQASPITEAARTCQPKKPRFCVILSSFLRTKKEPLYAAT